MFFDKRFKSTLLTSVSMGAVLIGTNALANPEGANVVTGDVAINGIGTDHVIIQNDSNRAIVNWDTFSIGAGETTTINQITNDAAILNRVVTNNVSEIYGTLRSNGQVFLINQSGIVIGASGIVDTNGLVASTLDVSNADFLGGGDMIFKQGIQRGGGIEVHGKIRSVSGGDIFLLSREITIGASAEINSNGGYVGLGAGEEILLRPTDTGDGRISIRAGKGKIVNQGTIEAVAAELKAAGGNEYALAINNTGVVRATGYSKSGGKIRLGGGGKVRNTGKLIARKKVIVRSKKKIENSGQIKAGDGNNGGEIIFEAPEIEVKADSILDVAGALGGGRIFVGGGYQGSGADHDGNEVDITDNAIKVTVDDGAVLTASATQSGDAGEIVIWADGETVFAGDIVASAAQGHGGDVEVSGKQTLNIAGITANLRGSQGNGTLLLDPTDITITAGGTTGSNTIADDDIETLLGSGNVEITTGTGAGSALLTPNPGVVGPPVVSGTFDDTGGGGAGDVTFEAGVRILWADDSKLAVTAARDIKAEDDVIIQHNGVAAGASNIEFTAGRDIVLGGTVVRTDEVTISSENGASVFTAGNDIKINGNANGNDLLSHAAWDGSNTYTAGNNIDIGQNTDVLWSGNGKLTFKATNDINALDDIQIQHSDSNTDNAGGVVFLAGNNINIGDAGVTGTQTTIRTGGVAIGSEHGSNIFVAGDANFDQAVDDALGAGKTGNINVIGGDQKNAHAHLGYIQTNAVGTFGNGAIVVKAAGNITLTGGDEQGAFAQIGHGGAVTDASGGAISGNITVVSDAENETVTMSVTTYTGNGTGNVVLNHAEKNSDVTNSSDGTHAQIGHGSYISSDGTNDVALSQGTIAGNLSVTTGGAGKTTSNLEINTTFTSSGDGTNQDELLSQIGHGAHITYGGTTVNGVNSIEVGHAAISGDITLDVNGKIIAGVTAAPGATDNQYIIQSKVGHGGQAKMGFVNNLQKTNDDNSFDAVHEDISGDINVTAGQIDLIAKDAALNSALGDGTLVDNSQQSQIGHGSATVFSREVGAAFGETGQTIDPTYTITDALLTGTAVYNVQVQNLTDVQVATLTDDQKTALLAEIDGQRTASNITTASTTAGRSVDVARNVTATDNRISGNITVTDDSDSLGGITLESDISVGDNAITKDVMVTRIGHASVVGIDSLHGSQGKTETFTLVDDGGGSTTSITGIDADGVNAFNGGNVTVRQAHILGADITIDTKTLGDADVTNDFKATDNQDISIKTSIAAGLNAVEDNTAVAQIGHGGDVFVSTGNGGASSQADVNSADGGDISIIKGTVWDGSLVGVDSTGDYNSVDISLVSSNQVIVDSDTEAVLAAADRNNAESSIGHGFKLRLRTEDGGTSTDKGAAGGRGGDIKVTQRTESRDLGLTNVFQEETARGLRGNITIVATEAGKGIFALDLTAGNASDLAATNNNTDLSSIGHGDFIEATTGDGGNGSTTNNDEDTQEESYGARGGHIKVDLNNMLIESDLDLTQISGAINMTAKSANALAAANRDLVETVIGHQERIFAHAGDGGNGGDADYLANKDPILSSKAIRNEFGSASSGNGATTGGNGGDIEIKFGSITDRVISGTQVVRTGEADIHVVVKDHNDTANSLTIQAEVGAGVAEGNGADVFAGIGHHIRLYGEGGKGGDGGETRTQLDEDPQDTNYSIQPDASGGRGGDVRLSSGNIVGDVVVDVTRQAVVDSIAGHGTFTKVIAGIGHTTDLVAVTQNGGNGGDLSETGIIDTDIDGGIDALTETNPTVGVVVLLDGNDDDNFNLNGVDDNLNDADDTSFGNTANEDGIDTNNDGVAETFSTLGTQFGIATAGGPVSPTGGVIYHDEEGDPAFILDASSNLIANDSVTGTVTENATIIALRANTDNMERFGRVVGNYEADFNTTDATAPRPHFVDIDQDGDVDFVDFDADGRIDIVDIDKDGVYDEIDGRSSPRGNESFGILDYVAVTGLGYSQLHLQGGWELADFSTSNGGRGGDAQTSVGMTMGHVAVDVGNPTIDVADSLIVRSTVVDATAATGGPRDVSIARIGHGAFQMSDTGGSYAMRAAGRTEVDMDGTTQGHLAANGGNAGNFAINGNGGRGGDASVTQGALRDIDPRNDANGAALTVNETDHLVGNIYVNNVDSTLPSDLRLGLASQNDSKRISVLATADNDAGTNISVAQIGHGSQAAATAGAWTGNHGALVGTSTEGNTGGKGASNGGTAANDTSSQTELADGGRGGDASLTQNQIKGTINVRTGADNGTGGNSDFSIEVKATKGPATAAGASNNIVTAQIGHGRNGIATGGKGGDGDDGQLSGNGGRGGDVTATQTAIIDTAITIDLVDSIGTTNGYYGNGLWIDSTTQLGSQQIVRGQVGHGDLVFAESGAGGNGSNGGKSDVMEQRNQTVNGGRGGDATINQHGYNYDITLDLGPNIKGDEDEALKITSHVDTTNVGTKNHTFAAVGHGGYAEAIANKGGDGGDRNDTNGISSSNDPNQRDGVDATNRITLGTDRSGGRGGNAVSNIGVNGTGRTYSATTSNDRSGLIVVDSNHNTNETNMTANPIANVLNSDGADINITLNDDLSGGGAAAAARDGVLVEAKTGQGDTQTRAIDTTTAIIGHTGYNRVDATVATGGNAIDTAKSATISEGDGGDGGSATVTTGFVIGDISVINTVGDTTITGVTGINATDIIIRAVDQTSTDGARHRADARIGHMVSAEALSGAGGDSAIPGNNPVYPATVSTRGGDGGDASVTQASLSGSTTLTAEGSIQVLAADGIKSSPTLAAAIGHRLEADADALDGGLGGLSTTGSQNQNLYFIYEALREFDLRIKGGATQNSAFDALSAFEQKLVAPFYTSSNYRANTRDKHGYYDDKYIGHFLDKMLEGPRDNNFVGGTNNTIQALSGGTADSDSGEQRTLLAIMAASGDGGHTSITQGSAQGVADGNNFILNPINDFITLNASSLDTDNDERGIIVRASDGATGGGFQIAHIGHQNEVIRAHAGEAAGVRAYSNGIGGDGGDVDVTQYEHSGKTTLNSDHMITVEAKDGTTGSARQRAWVGHRQTIAPDRPSYHADPVVKAGNGGSELAAESEGRNGNGGDVNITQHGFVTSGDNNVDIVLSALKDTTDSNTRSIVIGSSATGATAEEAETHIGHDFMVASVKAGDAGRRFSSAGPASLDEGVLEGNGGDIRIQQTDLGADIDITGKDSVEITATSLGAGGSDAHTIIGHERTIGEIADKEGEHNTGTIEAGKGGDTTPEDYNNTAEINPTSSASGTTQVEDGDGGTIYITTGVLTDALNLTASTDNDGLVTITSLTEDVDIKATSTLGDSDIEIGNQQQVHAEAGEGGVQNGTTAQTAGDGGDVRITRGEVGGQATDGGGNGDILIQAIAQTGGTNKEVNITSNSTSGSSDVLIGHEVYYDVTSGRSGFGSDDFTAAMSALKLELAAITDLADATTFPPNTIASQEATLREANAAYQAIQNARRAVALAKQNLDRYTSAQQTRLTQADEDANTALTAANTALTDWNNGIGKNDTDRFNFINAIKAAAVSATTALNNASTMLIAANGTHGSTTQLGDHADGGDILYTATNALSSNATVAREGYVTGNVNLISGEDTNSDNIPDDFNGKGVVIFTSTAAAGAAQTEAGHRRTMSNTSGIGGGHTNGPPTGGVSGDGGNITVANNTLGDTTFTSDEVVIRSSGGGGKSEVHLLHDVEITNKAGKSDIESRLGNGGDIAVTQNVSGGATLNANHLSSAKDAKDAEDSKLGAEGVATTLTHLGHQVEMDNDSDSDEGTGSNGTNNANRGGAITVSQSVAGATDGDLVTINLALTTGNVADLTIDAIGTGKSEVHLGSDVETDSRSGNPTDDGSTVTSIQTTSGDLEINGIEDLLITSLSTPDHEIHLGHAAAQNAQSGDTNGSTGNEYGEKVTATQTVSGNVTLDPSRTFEVKADGTGAQDIQIGHEAVQLAKSASDTATPPDGTNNEPDVEAIQTIQAQISVVTGGILMSNAGTNRVQLGHEAFITVDTDADGHVKSRSRINPTSGGNDDIILTSTGTTGTETDAKVTGSAGSANGDIELIVKTAANEVQVGHRSTSSVSKASNVATGTFDTEQSIGGSDSNGDGLVDVNADTTVTNTASSTITVNAFRDLRVRNTIGGDSQIGHYIAETSDLSGTDAVATPDSIVRQTVGSDIVIGDGTPGSSTGIGNNLLLQATAGNARIGHRSPDENEWQLTGGEVITPQILDGDITIEAGINATQVAPDGTTSTTAGVAGDDIHIEGDNARVGHDFAHQGSTSGNLVQVSAGDIWMRARGDFYAKAGGVGHWHYDFVAPTKSNMNAIGDLGTVRNRIRGNTSIGAGQNSPSEDSVLTANVLHFDGATINSGYGGQDGKDVNGQLRFFVPAQENVRTENTVKFNDSASAGDAVPDRTTSSSDNVFLANGGNDHEHPFTTMSTIAEGTTRAYTNAFIGAGNFTFYFEPEPEPKPEQVTELVIPFEFTPFLYRGSNDSGFSVRYLNDDGSSAGGSVNTDGLSEDYIGTSSYDVACEEQAQSGGISQDDTSSSDGCSEVSDQYNGIQPGFGSNTEWSGQAGGNSNSVIPYLDEDDELGDNKQVVGFTVYEEPVITTQTFAVEQTSASYFNVKTVTRRLTNYDGRVITRNTPSGVNPFKGFGRTVTNPSPLKNLNSPITTSTQGNGVNSFDVSNNAVFSTTTHQYFTGFDAGNDYQVTAVDNRIGTYVDETGIDAYLEQHAGAMSFASSYQVFEEKSVE